MLLGECDRIRLAVTREGWLISILGRANLTPAFLSSPPQDEKMTGISDADIRQHSQQGMMRHPWIAHSAIQAAETQGAVDLGGIVTGVAMREVRWAKIP